ncbi:MAG: Rieske 2Fe-2S domain-containing protein [Actinomycetota bacterium]|nr:Rieske 2Fe-2S domain-containing protein [Actinomycetota bacterium]
MSDEPREPGKIGATALAATCFIVGIVGAVAFAVVYRYSETLTHEGVFTQALGGSLMVAFLGIGAGLVVWAHSFMPGEASEERPFYRKPGERREAAAAFREQTEAIGRRSLLGRLLVAALGVTGLAALVPLRSLGPSPLPDRRHSGWRPGDRLVSDEGKPVAVDELEFNSVLTVFPESLLRQPDSQTVLLRVPPELLQPQEGREDWSPEGYIAFSKVCTHAGCPVGLYQVESQRLFCPCHQSAFDVLQAAKPLFGPATRPLPQLPLAIDAEGFLIAQDEFHEPVGPGFWTLP